MQKLDQNLVAMSGENLQLFSRKRNKIRQTLPGLAPKADLVLDSQEIARLDSFGTTDPQVDPPSENGTGAAAQVLAPDESGVVKGEHTYIC